MEVDILFCSKQKPNQHDSILILPRIIESSALPNHPSGISDKGWKISKIEMLGIGTVKPLLIQKVKFVLC